MAYTDRKEMTPARFWSLVLVFALHGLLLYALVNGGYEVAKKKLADLNVIDIKEPPPPPPEKPLPPPPKENLPPPPVVSPPPIVQTQTVVVPTVTTQATPPPVFVPTPEPPRPAPPPPPPPPPAIASKAVPRGGSGAIDDSAYPPSAIRNEEQGTTIATFTIGADGRISSCSAKGASTSLDQETCRQIQRWRYKPAMGSDGNPIAETRTQRVTWRLPKD
jgi:periplasmic protein TonB